MHHRYEEVSTGESALKGMGNELRKLSTSALNGRKTLLLECLRDLANDILRLKPTAQTWVLHILVFIWIACVIVRKQFWF